MTLRLIEDPEDRLASWAMRALAQGLRRGRLTFRQFCEKYFPHYMDCQPSEEFHFWLMSELTRLTRERAQKEVIVAPRGYAKSSIISVMYVCYCICEKLEPYIVLFSDTFSQSAQHLKNIKLELENNEKLAEDYPEAVGEGPTWSKEAIVTNNGIKIDVIGTHGKIRGRREGAERPSLVIGDDPENDESAASPTMRENCRSWFESGVLKAGGPKTNYIVIGTMINSECLVAHLMTRPGWKGKVFRAIMTWPDAMDKWDHWEQLYTSDEAAADEFYASWRKQMEAGAVVLWPAREPLLALMKMRAEGHLSFLSEKQNQPGNPAQCFFQEAWLDPDQRDLFFDEPPARAECFCAVDPTVGNDVKKGDFAALVWGWFAKGDPFIYVDCIIERMTSPDCVDRALDLSQKLKFRALGWESNAAQSIIAGQLAEKMRKRNIHTNVVEIIHNEQKPKRIQRLGPYLQRGAFKFRRNSAGVKHLLKQTRMQPIADHDDGPDALEMLTCIVRDYASAA